MRAHRAGQCRVDGAAHRLLVHRSKATNVVEHVGHRRAEDLAARAIRRVAQLEVVLPGPVEVFAQHLE
ncbi:hypothetical protein [Gulosibacter sp. ACHW.36C]|uniref:Uncharacterized protein n=1 Tax=Gulosibacter sediminis TaxID=1729695 RepID=A0ABY4MW02_9MICO|nr:hypothetical protein [Gulosibacter sediminis]UQN14224.1 hypothetical protein M3M28_09200 [Gulosibacter sediminis]